MNISGFRAILIGVNIACAVVSFALGNVFNGCLNLAFALLLALI